MCCESACLHSPERIENDKSNENDKGNERADFQQGEGAFAGRFFVGRRAALPCRPLLLAAGTWAVV